MKSRRVIHLSPLDNESTPSEETFKLGLRDGQEAPGDSEWTSGSFEFPDFLPILVYFLLDDDFIFLQTSLLFEVETGQI